MGSIGVFLMVALFLAAGLSGATARGVMILSMMAALSLACLATTVRHRAARRCADEELLRLRQEADARSAALASVTDCHTATLDRMLAGCQKIGFDWRYLYVNDVVARQGRREKPDLVGRTMMECYPGIENTPMFAVLRECMEARASAVLENEFVYPDGSAGWFELSVHPVPEGIFIASLDISDRKRAEMNMQRQLGRLQTLRAIDLAILNTTDMAVTLRTILEEARNRLQADGADIRLFNAETLMLRVVAVAGRPTPAPGAGVRLGQGIAGTAARERRTIAISDTATDAPLAELSARAVYAAPLVAKGNLIGVLSLYFNAPFDGDSEWLDFLETVAGQTSMAVENATMYDELQRSHMDLRLAYDTTIEGWSRALDLRDKETEGHTQRVTELTLRLARRAGMSEAELVDVRRGALLHDIGKMGVPDHILLKPDKLTDDEWRLMKQHPTYAYELLKPIEYLRGALDIPLCHHEKWDGSGYPRGLKGAHIPLAARIFAVVDVWDAIRSDRPYRSGWSEERALEFINSVSGTHLDPDAVDLFMRVHAEDTSRQAEESLAPR
ncbi:MAG TPA: HD domain-containing phosphohydrolase [Candidatus Krumholzibacteria bacterium]|nr:HD domain-containing phosphohydrolase [Candidatus Krumholzibacteria bacterium]